MTADKKPEAARMIRAASGPFVLVLTAAIGVYLLVDAVVRSGPVQTFLLAPWVLLAFWMVYEMSFVSSVRVDHDGATVRNLLRRTDFGWAHVRDIDMRWQLVFSLDDGSDIACYGGPARSRPPRVSRDGEAKAPADLIILTDIRDRWKAAAGGADAPIRRTWDWPALIALAVIVAWATASVLLAGRV